MATERVVTDLACHPGEYLLEELDAREMTVSELADVLGRSKQSLRGLLAGKSSISVATALSLEALWGISAETWLNLQQSYDLTVARATSASA